MSLIGKARRLARRVLLWRVFFTTAWILIFIPRCSIQDAGHTRLMVSFTYSPASPVPGQLVRFKDTSTGSANSWHWDFGDGATSSVQSPSHGYSAAGSYAVSLTISAGSDSSGTSSTITVKKTDTIMAASASYADVSSAIAAASSGDTVLVPGGSATWSNQLIITKGIFLIGAGIDTTVITSSYSATGGSNQDAAGGYLIVYQPANPSSNEPFRLSGFTFNLGNKCAGVQLRNATTTPINSIRVDHNRIINIGGPQIVVYVKGTVYGVADNNVSVGGYYRCNGLNATTWSNFNFDYGSADNFYFEDNTISAIPKEIVFYNECSGRFCARYNHITSTGDLFPMIDMHGLGGGSELDTMGGEAYGNTLTMGSYSGTFMDQRAGKALVYNNSITTTGSMTMKMREEENDNAYSPTHSPNGQPRHVSDSFYWGNTRNGGLISEYYIGGTINYGGSEGIVPRFDVHVWVESDLTKSYAFDGSQGVGFGLLANRPVTCAPGVAYWATDENKLYRCMTQNVWILYYTPFAYPHPLRTIR